MHTAEYSCDSSLRIDDAIERAIAVGLDGICVTDHESQAISDMAVDLTRRHGLLVIPGAEINTFDGDFLVFGLSQLPLQKMRARELVSLVDDAGGFAVAAHPYRNNGRGAGDSVIDLGRGIGIEVLNGRTDAFHNRKALDLVMRTGSASLGGSDAHTVFEVGRFATRLDHPVRGLEGFIDALRKGGTAPVFENGYGYELYQETDLLLPWKNSTTNNTVACGT